MEARRILEPLLENADIKIDGTRPWDIQVHDDRLYKKIFQQGTLGIGEAYMDGWWDCQAMDVMFCKAIKAHLESKFSLNSLPGHLLSLWQAIFNLQTSDKSREVAKKHYDFGNDMFEWMLGPTMNYSCAYWRNADNLDAAQNAKMDLICRKLYLEPGMKVLDIGCGWGSLAMYMASHYDVKVTGISISREQIEYARNRDTVGKIEWVLDDYRSLQDKYDRIVSVGMFEHVGYKNYGSFMREVRNLLNPAGLFLLHTIGANHQRKGTDPWVDKYIFPNGMLPSEENLTKAFVDLFIMEDWQNFGADYDKTLMCWAARFEEGCEQKRFKCDERTRRMFRYYLLSCAGGFRARDMQLWQVVLSPYGVPGGYVSVR